MPNYESPFQPDGTTEAIQEIIVTLGGDVVTTTPQPGIVRRQDQQSEQFKDFDPADLAEGAATIAKFELVRERLSDILRQFRRYPSLPGPAEIPRLAQIHGTSEPLLLEQPVTVSDMIEHLEQGDDHSHEIALQIFGDSYVLFLGDKGEVSTPEDWVFLEPQATARLHTHPGNDPNDTYPSPNDLEGAQYTTCPQAVVSKRGIIVYPDSTEYMNTGLPLLWQYLKTTSFTPTGDIEKDYYRLMNGYIEGVLHLQVIPWDELPRDYTMQEAINYAIGLRNQQRVHGWDA